MYFILKTKAEIPALHSLRMGFVSGGYLSFLLISLFIYLDRVSAGNTDWLWTVFYFMCREVFLPHLCIMWRVCLVPSEVRGRYWTPWYWSYRWLWETMWVLGMKPQSYRRALNCWATSQVHGLELLILHLSRPVARTRGMHHHTQVVICICLFVFRSTDNIIVLMNAKPTLFHARQSSVVSNRDDTSVSQG